MAVRIELQQVLLNLVINAIEAMANVSDRPRVVRLHCEPYERNGTAGVLVEVEDAGMGSGARTQRGSMMRSTRPSRTGSAWACPSLAPSSRATAADSGRRPIRATA